MLLDDTCVKGVPILLAHIKKKMEGSSAKLYSEVFFDKKKQLTCLHLLLITLKHP